MKAMVWNGAHFHLMLNHVPVVILPLATMILVIGIWTRNFSVAHLADWLVVSAALSAVAAFGSGYLAETFLAEQAIAMHDVIEQHHNAALYALIMSVAAGAWSTLMIVLFLRKPQLYFRIIWVTLSLGLIASSLLAWSANEGGKIRHTEIRPEGWEERLNTGRRHEHE